MQDSVPATENGEYYKGQIRTVMDQEKSSCYFQIDHEVAIIESSSPQRLSYLVPLLAQILTNRNTSLNGSMHIDALQLVVGTIESPYLYTTSHIELSDDTYVVTKEIPFSLTGIWMFNNETGEILTKVSTYKIMAT
ncbi:MAG TPA: hypothetical protein DEQ40_15135 [Oxalobacteraceae bacterium]|jgi:hypothetical protein|nr:hypothetical protein [Oxalobacteraceae bacterium]